MPRLDIARGRPRDGPAILACPPVAAVSAPFQRRFRLSGQHQRRAISSSGFSNRGRLMILRRFVTLLSAGALAAGLSTALAGTARADVPPSPTWNEIVSQWDHNFNNTLCV